MRRRRRYGRDQALEPHKSAIAFDKSMETTKSLLQMAARTISSGDKKQARKILGEVDRLITKLDDELDNLRESQLGPGTLTHFKSLIDRYKVLYRRVSRGEN